MILEDIKNKLKEIDQNVFYGIVDNSIKEMQWNYIVFERKRMRASENKSGYSFYYSVHLIREAFIPEGEEESVIEKMLEIPGMRLAGDDGEYTYIQKPNTNTVIEMFSIDFMKAKKR